MVSTLHHEKEGISIANIQRKQKQMRIKKEKKNEEHKQ